MVMDHYADKWGRQTPVSTITSLPNFPTQQEIDEFRQLLERAREYDRKNGEPDCELQQKRQKLLDLARELGVEIDFL